MKRFILSIAKYIFTVCIITVMVNYVYIHCDNYPIDSCKKFDYVPDGIEICNFGSSHGEKAFDYTQYCNDYVCFNFALGSQSLSYDARILDYYQDKLDAGAIVLIPVSYFSLFGYSEINESDFESKNLRYYSILPSKYIMDYNLYTDIMTHRIRAINDGPRRVIKAIISPNKRQFVKSWPDMYNTVEDVAETKLKSDGRTMANKHIIEGKRDLAGKLVYNDDNIAALYNIISICQKRSATPVLITVPYLKEYTDAIKQVDPYFLENFYELLNSIVVDTGTEYYDYSTDARFWNNHLYFYNVDHMNTYGARKFTAVIYDEVIRDIL